MKLRSFCLLVGLSLLGSEQAASQGDAGKREDAGDGWQSATRLVPVKDDRVPGGRLAAWQGTLGSGDTVDLFRTPTLGRDQFISLLVVPGLQTSAVYSVKVTNRDGRQIFAERTGVSGRQTLDTEVSGEVAIRLETAVGTPAFEYGVALLVAPPPRHPLLEIEVKNPAVKPPEGFTFIVPAKKGEASASATTAAASPAPASPSPPLVAQTGRAPAVSGSRLWMYGGAVLLVTVGVAGYLIGRRRS